MVFFSTYSLLCLLFILYIADIPNDIRVGLKCPKVEIPGRKGERGPHPWLDRVVEGEPEPIEVRKIAKDIPEVEKERVFLRDTERKELWCNMVFACVSSS